MEEGKVIITIDECLKKKNISKNQLQELSNIQRTQLNSYANNKVKRIDLDVLARICGALDASIDEILCYEKNENQEDYNER